MTRPDDQPPYPPADRIRVVPTQPQCCPGTNGGADTAQGTCSAAWTDGEHKRMRYLQPDVCRLTQQGELRSGTPNCKFIAGLIDHRCSGTTIDFNRADPAIESRTHSPKDAATWPWQLRRVRE